MQNKENLLNKPKKKRKIKKKNEYRPSACILILFDTGNYS